MKLYFSDNLRITSKSYTHKSGGGGEGVVVVSETNIKNYIKRHKNRSGT
jgi:hypothetical protein